jgi:hypothetical protein
VTNPERFHLTLTLDGVRAIDGWWGSEANALRQFASLVGQYGDKATISLEDTETGEEIASWPPPVVGGDS